MIADVKAVLHVLQAYSYRYPKRVDSRVDARMLLGDNMPWAHGEWAEADTWNRL